MRLYLFGAPRLEHNDQPISLRRTKALALLAYLVIRREPVQRDTLLELLWPEFDQASARNNLRRELSLLRSTLGDAVLLADRQQIAWNPHTTLWMDVAVFQDQLAAARQMPPTPERAATLSAALDLATSDFLAGFSLPESASFEEWQFFQREALRQQLVELLTMLLAWHYDQQEYQAAIAYARRWLALDPLHEPAQRALMRLYALAGEHSAAIRQYEACVQQLDKALGLAPEPETTELYAAIRARQIAAPAPPPVAPAASAAVTSHHPAAQPSPDSAHIELRYQLPSSSGFIARERELAEIARQLADPSCRLMTLTGPGGIGKTRLALQVAQRLVAIQPESDLIADGLHFVSLAPINDPALVAATIAHSLKIPEQAGSTPLQRLIEALRAKHMLLLLDNVEHVIAAAAQIAALLEGTAHLTILLTSREALRIQSEQEYPVPPLDLPTAATRGSLVGALQSGSVQLFVERARALRPDFAVTADNIAAISAICERLDGLPLAIELAAARIRLLPPQALLKRLERRLPLLSGGGPDRSERHRTLRAAIDWSYDLLHATEQRLFRRLAVFVGGAPLEAVIEVCGDGQPAAAGSAAVQTHALDTLDLLDALIARSLLVRDEVDGEARVRMLATIQEYAEEKLAASGELAAVQQRHGRYYADWAEQAHQNLFGPEHRRWLAQIDLEHANLRAALQRAQADRDVALMLGIAGTLGRFWGLRGYLAEGRTWLAAALGLAAVADAGGLALAQARALLGLGNLCRVQGDFSEAGAAFGHSLALYRALNDQYGTAQALNGMGVVAHETSCFAQARAYYRESLTLFRALGAQERTATVLNNLANALWDLGDRDEALVLYPESLALQRALGNATGIALSLHNVGLRAYDQGHLAMARPYLEQSLAIKLREGNLVDASHSLFQLGVIAAQRHELEQASHYMHESLRLAQTAGSKLRIIEALEGWAYLAVQQGRYLRAVRLFSASAAERERCDIFYNLEKVPIAPTRDWLRAQLGGTAWEQAWYEGQQLDWRLYVAAPPELEGPPALTDAERRGSELQPQLLTLGDREHASAALPEASEVR